MSLTIRKAENKDTAKVLDLLHQVLEVHADIRPDLFISGTTKYTDEELRTRNCTPSSLTTPLRCTSR